MTYEGLPIEGAHMIPNFNGVGIINLEDYNKKELSPPQIEGGIFDHIGVLDLDEVDENDEKWLNKGIREEGNTEDRIQSFENKFEVDGFKTTYIPPIMGTDDEPRDGHGRIIAAKRRGEKKIPVYYYVITDKSETCKITTLVDKSQVIMNNNIMDNTTNNSSDNTCNHVYKHHEINDN